MKRSLSGSVNGFVKGSVGRFVSGSMSGSMSGSVKGSVGRLEGGSLSRSVSRSVKGSVSGFVSCSVLEVFERVYDRVCEGIFGQVYNVCECERVCV